jgi:hypothetical protein
MERVNIALTKFGRMSSSEIVTPAKVADQMVALLPESLSNSDGLVLDIASKQAEFTVALMRRYGDQIGQRTYAICTSMLAYEFTRKVYSLLSLPTQNVFSNLTSFDLIKPDNTACMTTLNNLNFKAVIGNPPYQIQNNGDGNGADPIYHLFINKARELSNISILVHPARFLFNAGKTPKIWNQQILNETDFKVTDYWANSANVFPNVDVKGGIAITLSDHTANFSKIGVYSPFPEVRSIIQKVKEHHEKSLSEIVYPRDLYKLTDVVYKENPFLENRQSNGHRLDIGSSIYDVLPEIFLDQKPQSGDYIGIYGLQGRERVTKWVKRSYIKFPDNLDEYKVLVPKSNGSGALGEVLSTPVIGVPVIGVPVIGHTLTFLSIGKFKKIFQAEACLKYIKSRFARLLLGSLKVTQDNPRDTWANVPMQDFTANSDIDWSCSVAEIDQQLYEKYHLNDKEIQFIESMIQPM